MYNNVNKRHISFIVFKIWRIEMIHNKILQFQSRGK